MAKIGKIIVENKELKTWETSEVINTDVGIKDEVYSIVNTVKNQFKSEIFHYRDFTLFFSNEDRFGDVYLNFVLFRGEQEGYKLLNIQGGLDIKVLRLEDKKFVVIGNNANCPKVQGQVSFCELLSEGNVVENVKNFSHLLDYKIFIKPAVAVLTCDELPNSKGKIEYSYLCCIYDFTGKIISTIYDKKFLSEKDLYFTIKRDVLTLFERNGKKSEKVGNFSFNELKRQKIKEEKASVKKENTEAKQNKKDISKKQVEKKSNKKQAEIKSVKIKSKKIK